MEKKLLAGQIEHISWNSIVLKRGDTKDTIAIPARVLSQLETGQHLHLLFRKNCLVRIFNRSTQTVFETDFFAHHPGLRKYQTLIFLVAAMICAIPVIGAAIGMVLIAVLIGTSLKRNEEIAIKVALVSAVTAVSYVALASLLLLNGHFWWGFIACAILVFMAFKSAATISAQEARLLSQEVSRNE